MKGTTQSSQVEGGIIHSDDHHLIQMMMMISYKRLDMQRYQINGTR